MAQYNNNEVRHNPNCDAPHCFISCQLRLAPVLALGPRPQSSPLSSVLGSQPPCFLLLQKTSAALKAPSSLPCFLLLQKKPQPSKRLPASVFFASPKNKPPSFLPEEHIRYRHSGKYARSISKKTAGHGMARVLYPHTSKINRKNIERSVGASLEDA